MNAVFLVMIASAVLVGAARGKMPELTDASFAAAKSAVELAIGLVGQMALWLGFLAVLARSGVLVPLSRGVGRLLAPLFPDVPPGHPAMAAMVLNVTANVLGLNNAATPFGIKAMRELDRLNPRPGVATNAMALFLAINTAGIATLPIGAMAVRAKEGASQPAAILAPGLLASFLATLVAIAAAVLLSRLSRPPPEVEASPIAEAAPADEPPGPTFAGRRALLGAGLLAALVALIVRAGLTSGRPPFETVKDLLAGWTLPSLMLAVALVGFATRVRVYEAFVEGAKEGFDIAVQIIPYLVAILVAVGMLRASGVIDDLTLLLGPLVEPLGVPAEALPMALVRPLSGSGALAVLADTMKASGPDSLASFVSAILCASSETTFYVLAVYFGAVKVRDGRHTLAACLTSDVAAVFLSAWVARAFF